MTLLKFTLLNKEGDFLPSNRYKRASRSPGFSRQTHHPRLSTCLLRAHSSRCVSQLLLSSLSRSSQSPPSPLPPKLGMTRMVTSITRAKTVGARITTYGNKGKDGGRGDCTWTPVFEHKNDFKGWNKGKYTAYEHKEVSKVTFEIGKRISSCFVHAADIFASECKSLCEKDDRCNSCQGTSDVTPAPESFNTFFF